MMPAEFCTVTALPMPPLPAPPPTVSVVDLAFDAKLTPIEKPPLPPPPPIDCA